MSLRCGLWPVTFGVQGSGFGPQQPASIVLVELELDCPKNLALWLALGLRALGTTPCGSGRSKTSARLRRAQSSRSVEPLLLSRRCVQTRLAGRLAVPSRLGSGTTSSSSSSISCLAASYTSDIKVCPCLARYFNGYGNLVLVLQAALRPTA